MTDVYTWDSVPGHVQGGTDRREIPGDGASLKMLRIPAGTTAARHSHPHEQFVQVLEGTGRLECEAGTIPLAPGTVIRFGPEEWHSAVFETDTVLIEVNLRPAVQE